MQTDPASGTDPGTTRSRRRLYALAGVGVAGVGVAAAAGVAEPLLLVGGALAASAADVVGPVLNITGTGASGSAGAAGAGAGAGGPAPPNDKPPEDPCQKPLSEWKSIGGPSKQDMIEGTATDTALGAIDTAAKGPAGPAVLIAGGAQAGAQGAIPILCGTNPRNRSNGHRKSLDAAMDEISGRKYDNLRGSQ